jgi:hypothetical protein
MSAPGAYRKTHRLIFTFPSSGQLAPTQLPLGDAFQPGSLEVVGFDASLGGGPLSGQPLEHPPRHPDHAAILADLDPELHRLPLGISSDVSFGD